MYLSKLQKMLCKQIDDAQLHFIADCVGLNFYVVERQLPTGETVKVMPNADAERFEIRNAMRSFITLWYLLEKFDLVRSVPMSEGKNRLALYKQNDTETLVPNSELLAECSGYLDRQIIPLFELHDFIEDNKIEDDWLTLDQRNTREALRAAKRANIIAWVGIVISFLVGSASILIPIIKN